MPGCSGWDGVAPLPLSRVIVAVVGQHCAQRGFPRARMVEAGFMEVVGLCLRMPNWLRKDACVSLAASLLASNRDVLCNCSIPASEEAEGNIKC